MTDRLTITVPNRAMREALGEVPRAVDVLDWVMDGPAPSNPLDIVVAPYMGTTNALRHLAGVRVRLVQGLSNGYDGVKDALPPNMVFANAASVHETATSELVMSLILASQRGIPDFVRAAQHGQWSPRWHPGLADHTVLIVGYGGIGQAIERRVLPFETKVLRVARTERIDERGTIFAFTSLRDLLPSADVVVVCVPLTPLTTRLIDDDFLSLMRDGTLLVNVARGPVADSEALLAHATSGRLRLALDVTDPEPLPDGHPLFALSNVLISPHVGGATAAALPRMSRLVRVQIDRMLNGDDPINVVLRT